jgi:glycosyltransferase involved in cell wall biosynthesis
MFDSAEFSPPNARRQPVENIPFEPHNKNAEINKSKDSPVEARNENVSILVAIPCYNEEIAIGSVVLGALRHVDDVVVIDDGSRDNTAQVAKLAGAKVIKHQMNLGKGAAIKTAFSYASECNYDILVLIDGDGQHNPEEIMQLVAPILAGEADVVNGSRYINGNDKNTPSYRRLGQLLLDKVTNMNSGLRLTDTQSGFRAFAVHTAPAFRFQTDTHSIESEMLIDASQKRLRIKEVEIGVRYDVRQPKSHPLKHGLRVLMLMLHDMELRRPLYYFTVPGLIFLIIGLTIGLFSLQTFFNGGSLFFGPTLVMSLLTLVGIFMAFTGIILHSMSRLLHEFRRGSL